MHKKIILAGLFLTLFFIFSGAPLTAHAALIDPGANAYEYGSYSLNDIMGIIIGASKWILGIVGSLALLMFIYGGFMFLISAGSSDKIGQAQKILVAAVIGLIIVFSSYMIIRFVSQAIGVDWQGGKIIPSSSTNSGGTIPNDCLETYGNKGYTCRDEAKSGYCVRYHCGNGSSVCCAPSCSEYTGFSCMAPSSGTNCKTQLCKGDGQECCQPK